MRYGTLSRFIDTAYIRLLQLERRNQGDWYGKRANDPDV